MRSVLKVRAINQLVRRLERQRIVSWIYGVLTPRGNGIIYNKELQMERRWPRSKADRLIKIFPLFRETKSPAEQFWVEPTADAV